MEVVQIPVRELVPNPWNVNRMSRGMQRKFTAYLRREGLVEPIVVRPHPEQEGRYEILGGFHRWSICKDELGYDKIPCVVVEGLDDKRAKVLSLNLNSMSGQPVPSLLSNLLSELHQHLPMADLEATLPWEQGEIEDFMSLMQVPEGFGDELEQEVEEADKHAPNVVTVVLDNEQHALWQQALALTAEHAGTCRNPRARTLELAASSLLRSYESGRIETRD